MRASSWPSSTGLDAGPMRRSSKSMPLPANWRRAEIPVAAPLALQAQAASIHARPDRADGSDPGALHDRQRASIVSASATRITGRAPELEDPDTLEWIGRFIGRIHAVGARSAVSASADADRGDLRQRQPRLAARDRPDPARCPARLARRHRAGARGDPTRPLRKERRLERCACTATATSATSCGTARARISSTSTMPSTGPRCRTCGCCCPAIAAR